MLKEYKQMFRGGIFSKMQTLQKAERDAYAAGYEKGKQEGFQEGFNEGYEMGKGLHDGNCHILSQRFNGGKVI